MGIFPYTCVECGGGYQRCGDSECEVDCGGGQTCYEEAVVIEHCGTLIEGIYDGYGVIDTVDDITTEYIPSEFREFTKFWYVKRKRFFKNHVKFVDKVWCKSCKLLLDGKNEGKKCARHAAIIFLGFQRFGRSKVLTINGKDVIRLIAQFIWESRINYTIWSNVTKMINNNVRM